MPAPGLAVSSPATGSTAKSPKSGQPAPLMCVSPKPVICFSLYRYQALVLVSGLHCIMPKGSVAPGNVLPPPLVPINGFTAS